MNRLCDRVQQLFAPGQGACRVPLHNHEVGVAIHGDTGQAFALTREQAQRGGPVRSEQQPPQLYSALETLGDCTGPWVHPLGGIAREHPDGHRMVPVQVSTRDEGAISRHEINNGASWLVDGPPGQGLAEDPRVATM